MAPRRQGSVLFALGTAALCCQMVMAALVQHELHVTVMRGAPDCYPKNLIVANRQWQYPIEVTQGDTLEVNVFNDLPDDYPMVIHGFSIHWHGLSLRGEQPNGPGSGVWYDGVSFVTQCPIPAGSNMTYVMQVNESPGTYWWHGHGGVEAVDGLYGPLIVRPKGEEPLKYDDEIILMVGDWFHDQAAQMAVRLNRPFDKNVTAEDPDRGGWLWMDLPQSMHMNGHGFFGDCALHSAPSPNPGVPITCKPENFSIPAGRSSMMPWASFENPGCTHWNTTVEQGKTYRIRITNVASLGYVTVVFQGHNVTLVAADGTPMEPTEVSQIDVNNGMRYDVLLKADQPVDNYWIFVQMQYRVGSPGGYGVLRYKGADNETLPTSDPPQPDTFPPWSITVSGQNLQGLRELYDTVKGPANQTALEIYGIELPGNLTSLTPPEATRTIFLNITQPLLEQTGQLRWALNNVAHMENPTCHAVLDEMYRLDGPAGWAEERAAATLNGLGIQAYNEQQGNYSNVAVYIEGQQKFIDTPRAAHHIIELQPGEVVDIVAQNLDANANGGDYRGTSDAAKRTAMEEHPLHLHGHKFWVMGAGPGMWNESAKDTYNTENPIYRDTYTLFKGGWTAIRFVADNPGAWAFHCHIAWHHFMGQRLVISENMAGVSERPAGFPHCPNPCTFSNAPWKKSFVMSVWGDTGYQMP